MNVAKPNKVDIVYSSDYKEFFYKDSDLPVCEGDPVGVDIEQGDCVHLVLFDDIYWDIDGQETF